jgi:hypothetical protein
MDGNSSLLRDLYSKCLDQNQHISTIIYEIQNGDHKSTVINKIKQKVEEKLENHLESVKLGEKLIQELPLDSAMIWKK